MSVQRQRLIYGSLIGASIFFLLGFGALTGLAAIAPQNRAISEFCQSAPANTFVAGCFTILGAAIGPLLALRQSKNEGVIQETKPATLEKKEVVATTEIHAEVEALNEDIQSLKKRLEKRTAELKDTRKLANRLRNFAILHLAFRYSYFTVIWFAALTLVAAVIQGGLQRIKQDGYLLTEPFAFLAEFAYSSCMAIFAFGLALTYMSRFCRKTEKKDLRYCYIIGAMPSFVAGLVSLLQFSPELLGLAWGDASNSIFYRIPYLQIPLIAWLAISRFLLFPSIGLSAAWFASWSVKD